MIKQFLMFSLVLFTALATVPAEWQNSPFYNTDILKKSSVLIPLLFKAGFQKTECTTKDNLTLPCFYKEKPNARYNIIIIQGWVGRIHEPAPFAAMLESEPCNIFFIEGRNTQWTWRLNSKIREVGEHNHYDVMAAISFVHSKNDKPIILLGICAGAFYSAQALLEYTKLGLLEHHHIKGLVLDSAWASPRTAVRSTIDGFVYHRLNEMMGKNGYAPREKGSWTETLYSYCKPLTSLFYKMMLKQSVMEVDARKNLHASLHTVPLPLLFIHSEDDDMVSIDEVKKLADKAQRPTTWWITEPSRHAIHHIKHKEEYKKRLVSFIDSVMSV